MFLIREAVLSDIPKLARVHVQSWQETYAGLIPDEVLYKIITTESREFQWQRTLANPKVKVFVAVDADVLIGFCSLSVQASQAELFTLYLLKAFQGLGFGKKLWDSALEYAKSQGAKSVLLWVLEDNPTRGFYEHLGGSLDDSRTEKIGDAVLLEVSYLFKL
jgi:ribosomal protein S18 acetylase RimI-like enzyme